jgi:hypothetical protein
MTLASGDLINPWLAPLCCCCVLLYIWQHQYLLTYHRVVMRVAGAAGWRAGQVRVISRSLRKELQEVET